MDVAKGLVILCFFIAVLVWFIIEFSIKITPLQIYLLASILILGIGFYFVHDYYSKRRETEYKGTDNLSKALRRAQEFWRASFNEDLVPVAVNERDFGYWCYGFIFKKTDRSNNPGDYVWMVVRMESGFPKVATFTGAPKSYEYEHKAISELVREMWRTHHPDYSGAPTDKITPERDMGYMRNKARRTQEVYHLNEGKKKRRSLTSSESILGEEDEEKEES